MSTHWKSFFCTYIAISFNVQAFRFLAQLLSTLHDEKESGMIVGWEKLVGINFGNLYLNELFSWIFWIIVWTWLAVLLLLSHHFLLHLQTHLLFPLSIVWALYCDQLVLHCCSPPFHNTTRFGCKTVRDHVLSNNGQQQSENKQIVPESCTRGSSSVPATHELAFLTSSPPVEEWDFMVGKYSPLTVSPPDISLLH